MKMNCFKKKSEDSDSEYSSNPEEQMDTFENNPSLSALECMHRVIFETALYPSPILVRDVR